MLATIALLALHVVAIAVPFAFVIAMEVDARRMRREDAARVARLARK